MVDVFISYAREDLEVAARLANRLQRTGLTVWWDRSLLAGDDIEQVIDTQINAAKAIVVIWSANSVQSTWVRSEASAGHAAKKLVPILLDTADLPRPFDQIHTLDFAKWNRKWDRRMAQLVRAIRQVASGEPLKPERSVLAKRSRRIISVGAVASTALVALAVVGDISGLISSLHGNNGDQELKGKIEQIDATLASVSANVTKQSEPEVSQLAVRKILKDLSAAGVPGDDAVYQLTRTGSLLKTIDILHNQYMDLPLSTASSTRYELLHQLGAMALDPAPEKATAYYLEILDLYPDDPVANLQLARLGMRTIASDRSQASERLERLNEQQIESEHTAFRTAILTAMKSASMDTADQTIATLDKIVLTAKSAKNTSIATRAGLMQLQVRIAYKQEVPAPLIGPAQGLLSDARGLSDIDLEMLALSTLGVIQFKAEAFDLAADTYVDMIALAQEANRLDAEINAHATLARTRMKMGQYDAARTNIARSIFLARASPSQSNMLGNLLAKSAEIEVVSGNNKKGCTQFRQALSYEPPVSKMSVTTYYPALAECTSKSQD